MNRQRAIELSLRNLKTMTSDRMNQSEVLKIKAGESDFFAKELESILETPEKQFLRDPLLVFAENMETRLTDHDETRGERGWENEDLKFLRARLVDELTELDQAIKVVLVSELDHTTEDQVNRVFDEACDAANFLMMIGDVVRQRFSDNQVKKATASNDD